MKRRKPNFQIAYLGENIKFYGGIILIVVGIFLGGVWINTYHNKNGELDGFMGEIFGGIFLFLVIEISYQRLAKQSSEKKKQEILEEANKAIKDRASTDKKLKEMDEENQSLKNQLNQLENTVEGLKSDLMQANYQLLKDSLGTLSKSIDSVFQNNRGYINQLIQQSKIQNSTNDKNDSETDSDG